MEQIAEIDDKLLPHRLVDTELRSKLVVDLLVAIGICESGCHVADNGLHRIPGYKPREKEIQEYRHKKGGKIP